MPSHEELFTQLEKENRPRILRICRAYLSDPDDANDLYQDIMVQVWLNLASFRHEAKASTWLYRIALNSAIMFKKKQSRLPVRAEGQELQLPANEPALAEALEQQQVLMALHHCIAQLEKQERLIISLVLEEVPYKEIAEALGFSTSHVGVKINRIKKKLAHLMESTKPTKAHKEKGESRGF